MRRKTRPSSLECDKHIFYFLSAIITGLAYVVYNCYKKHCLLALIFAFPILPATYSIYSTLQIYRDNFRALAIAKEIYEKMTTETKDYKDTSLPTSNTGTDQKTADSWLTIPLSTDAKNQEIDFGLKAPETL